MTPADDLQEAIDAHPQGTTFCLSRGVHRLEDPVKPKRGDALIGTPGAVVSGGKVITRWRKDGGGRWSSTGFLPDRPGTHGHCTGREPLCAYAEDVFVDKRRLRRVASRAAVTAGSVYAEYRTNTLTIGQDPHGHLVEQAVAPGLVSATVDGVTVANLVLEEAANEAQVGAVESRQVGGQRVGAHWRVHDNEIRLNHGAGLGIGEGTVVTGNSIHDQGQLGIGAWGRDVTISDNEIARNGTAGYSPDWEAGGTKSWMTEGETLSHNYVHDNRGPGLWADGGTMDTTYRYNEITDNWAAGIQHEISYDATIAHNLVSGNGRRHKGWAWDAGIQIQSSGGNRLLEVAHNVVTGNANGITLLDSGERAHEAPTPYGPHVVENVWVHANTVTMAEGEATGAVEDTGDTAIFTSHHNRFQGNTYHLHSLTGPHFLWADRAMGWRRWRDLGPGHDLSGRAEPLRR
ncbi:MAG TPA: right-handed parallel beta-helix repeat-containing protein [Nocardioidaceae bacterium]